MTHEQWDRLVSVIRNRSTREVAVALIADSPWLPWFASVSTMDYLCSQESWLRANLMALNRFPDVIFMPGTWVEYGVSIEPSAFGCPLKWWPSQPPSAVPVLGDDTDVARLTVPDPEIDGLMPVTLEWQRRLRPVLLDHGHDVMIVTARGPLAIASQLRGVTELLLDIKLDTKRAHGLIDVCTETTIAWLGAQARNSPQAAAVEVHDDIVGMLSPEDYEEFAHPYLERIFGSFPDCIHIYHNDTPGIKYPGRFADAGVHVLNFSHTLDIAAVDAAIGDRVCLMGNVPPVEVLVRGTPEETRVHAEQCISAVRGGFLLSAGGGLSPGTTAENIDALVEAAKAVSRVCVSGVEC